MTVSNNGTAVLTISEVNRSGDGVFAVTGGGTGGGSVTVLAGSSHDITVAFDPSVVGVYDGNIEIVSNDGTTDVAISGTSEDPEPDIVVSPLPTLEFGLVATTGGRWSCR